MTPHIIITPLPLLAWKNRPEFELKLNSEARDALREYAKVHEIQGTDGEIIAAILRKAIMETR